MDKQVRANIKPVKILQLLSRTKPCKSNYLWDTSSKSKLIESILIHLPLPLFYVDSTKEPWCVLDGSLRVITLKEYIIEDKFALKGLPFLPELEGLKFSQLPRHYQRELEETELSVCLIESPTSREVVDIIYTRVQSNPNRFI